MSPEPETNSPPLTDNAISPIPGQKPVWQDYAIPVGVILFVLCVDQMLKVWVKTHMYLGQEKHIIGNWFLLHFTENNGIAFGYEFEGSWGKLALTLFRIVASVFIFRYLLKFIEQGHTRGFVISWALIFAGATGNIIDSIFYGVWFRDINSYFGNIFHGKVVDMVYMPLITGHFPSWFPAWGGEEFVFFRPIYNLADASISIGVLMLLLFFRKDLQGEKI